MILFANNTNILFENAFMIALEGANHVEARENLLDRVMGQVRFRRASQRIRENRALALSLVAADSSGAVIGTVRLWHIKADGLSDALMLGPLAVDPAFQGLGIGGALMKAAIQHAAKAAFAAIILVGDPEYYARFGFEDTPAASLTMPGPFERHRLLALELQAGALSNAKGLIEPSGAKTTAPKARRKIAA